MTIFADQTENLVFASPDASNGQPSFRALTANDVPALTIPGTAASTMNANSANIQYTETYFTSPFKIPANTINQQTSFRVSVVTDNLTPYHANLNLRLGTAGNTSDNVIFNIQPATYPFIMELLVTIRSNGNSAVVLTAIMTPIPDVNNNISYSQNYTQSAVVDTTVANYLGVSYKDTSPAAGPNVFQVGVIEQIR